MIFWTWRNSRSSESLTSPSKRRASQSSSLYNLWSRLRTAVGCHWTSPLWFSRILRINETFTGFPMPQFYLNLWWFRSIFGQDWELQWSYMVKCEFHPHCSKHFRAQRIHSNTQHPRKQAPPLFFFGGPVRTWWRTHFGLHLSANWPEQWRWNQCSFTYGETLRKWCVQASHEFPGSCNSKRRSGRYFKEIFSGNWSSKLYKTLVEKQIPQVWRLLLEE